MDWLQKYGQLTATIISILGAFVWLNGKFNTLEKDMAVIKTVLIMHEIMPKELATRE